MGERMADAIFFLVSGLAMLGLLGLYDRWHPLLESEGKWMPVIFLIIGIITVALLLAVVKSYAKQGFRLRQVGMG